MFEFPTQPSGNVNRRLAKSFEPPPKKTQKTANCLLLTIFMPHNLLKTSTPVTPVSQLNVLNVLNVHVCVGWRVGVEESHVDPEGHDVRLGRDVCVCGDCA